MLYFTSTRNDAKGNEISGITGTKSADIFFTKKDDKGKWEPVEAVEGDLNSEYEEGACCFSPDGKTMYLTQCTYDSDYPRYAQIFTSSRSDASWSKPQLLQISKDTLSSYAHPAVSPDGLWLYFTSDMPGGQGGFDIWKIAITSHGLGGVENVGWPINTPGDEMFPAFRPNGDFYFSSNGHVGMGGLDIIKATQDSLGVWTLENLKYPMNSSGDDFGMTFEGLHNRGYFSTNRGDARGWDHIMSFEHPEVIQTVKGWVYEKDGYELPEGLVYMVGDDGTYLKLSVRGDGSFEQEVKPRVNYVFLGTCKGYLNHKEELSVDTSSVSQEFVLQFPLASIENPVLIRNIFYEFDSAVLLDSSKVALEDEEKQEICHSLNRRTEFKVLRTTYKLFDVPEEKAAPIKEELEEAPDGEGMAPPDSTLLGEKKGLAPMKEGAEGTLRDKEQKDDKKDDSQKKPTGDRSGEAKKATLDPARRQQIRESKIKGKEETLTPEELGKLREMEKLKEEERRRQEKEAEGGL